MSTLRNIVEITMFFYKTVCKNSVPFPSFNPPNILKIGKIKH